MEDFIKNLIKDLNETIGTLKFNDRPIYELCDQYTKQNDDDSAIFYLNYGQTNVQQINEPEQDKYFDGVTLIHQNLIKLLTEKHEYRIINEIKNLCTYIFLNEDGELITLINSDFYLQITIHNHGQY